MSIPNADLHNYRLLPPGALLISLLCELPLAALSWPLRPSGWMVAEGVFLICTGAWLNVQSDRMFRIAGVGVCPFSHTPTLLMSGPFSVTRNPMYLGLVATSTGLTIASGVLINLWIPAAYAIWLHYAYVLPEEQFLRVQFGSAFENYAARVPRWLIRKSNVQGAATGR